MKRIDDQQDGIINIAEYRKVFDNKLEIAATVKSFIEHDGFLILKALLFNFRREVKDKESYKTIHEFKADRRGVKIVDGLFARLESMIDEGEIAALELKKLIATTSETPDSLSLDGEGGEEGPER